MKVAVNGDSQFVGPAGSTATTLAVTIYDLDLINWYLYQLLARFHK